jgi:serine/threonine-protein kinase
VEVHPQVVLSPGDMFHVDYEVRRCLKIGGMAVVYEAVHRVTRRPCALKVLLPDVLAERGMRARFAIEARIPSEIDCAHVVEVLDAGVDEATGAAFLVMELLRGDDLETVLRRRGHLRADEALALLRQAARALDEVHAARVVHRDLKPSNLFLCEAKGAAPVLKVLDFGIAKILDGSAMTTRNLGTPVYMSPEQVRGDGDVDGAADVYALGHIAFTLLAGEPYWRAEAAAGGRVLFDRIEEGITERASVRAARREVTLPAAFDAWFARATAPEPEDRFATAGELVEALASALAGESTTGTSAKTTARVRLDPRARRWSARAMAAGFVAIGLSGGAWAALRILARPHADAAHRELDAAAPSSSPPAPPGGDVDARPAGAPTASPSVLAIAATAASASSSSPSSRPRAATTAPPRAAPATASALREAPSVAPSASPFGPGAF